MAHLKCSPSQPRSNSVTGLRGWPAFPGPSALPGASEWLNPGARAGKKTPSSPPSFSAHLGFLAPAVPAAAEARLTGAELSYLHPGAPACVLSSTRKVCGLCPATNAALMYTVGIATAGCKPGGFSFNPLTPPVPFN